MECALLVCVLCQSMPVSQCHRLTIPTFARFLERNLWLLLFLAWEGWLVQQLAVSTNIPFYNFSLSHPRFIAWPGGNKSILNKNGMHQDCMSLEIIGKCSTFLLQTKHKRTNFLEIFSWLMAVLTST